MVPATSAQRAIYIPEKEPKSLTSMEKLASELPDNFADRTDWTLKLVDGTQLPCHSQCVSAVSSVLAVAFTMDDTAACFPLPLFVDRDIAIGFLRWTYRLDVALTADLAIGLARLGDMWNIKGTFFV